MNNKLWFDYLFHSGTKGMKWGYNYKVPNGKRKAGDNEDEEFDENGLLLMSEYMQSLTPEEQMALVNPNYQESRDYQINCFYCTLAYELRMRGYDVEAKAYDDNNPTPNILEARKNIFIGGKTLDSEDFYTDKELDFDKTKYSNSDMAKDMRDLAKIKKAISDQDAIKSTNKNLKRFENIMRTMPEGTRGMLSVAWATGSGHSMVYEVKGRSVVIKDTQANKTYSVDDFMDKITQFETMRTDNLDINYDEIKKYVKNRG